MSSLPIDTWALVCNGQALNNIADDSAFLALGYVASTCKDLRAVVQQLIRSMHLQGSEVRGYLHVNGFRVTMPGSKPITGIREARHLTITKGPRIVRIALFNCTPATFEERSGSFGSLYIERLASHSVYIRVGKDENSLAVHYNADEGTIVVIDLKTNARAEETINA